MTTSSENFINTFVNPTLAFLTCLPLVLTMVVLVRIDKEKSCLFAYLKLETLFILADGLLSSFIPTFIIMSRNCFPDLNPIVVCILEYFGFNMISSIVEMTSIIMSFFATLSCFCMIDKNCSSRFIRICLNCNPNLVALATFALSTLTFSYQIFPFHIVAPNNETKTLCNRWIDNFKLPPYNILLSTSFSISYGLLALILIGLNVLLVVRIRGNFSSKNKSLGIKEASQERRKDAEKKLTIMIVADCSNLIAGRMLIFVLFIVNSCMDLSNLDFPLFSLSALLLLVSFNFKFLIFYKMNSKFKSETNLIMSKIKKILR